MSVSIEAVDSDLIQDGSEGVLDALLVEVDVVIGVVVVVVVVLVVVVATAAEGSAALTGEKPLKVRLSAACTTDGAGCTTDGAAPTGVAGAFNPRREISIDPVLSNPLSVSVEWPVCDFNDIT
jgi:hypothetical protein